MTSLVLEGVFERFPSLKVVLDRGRLRLAAVAELAARPALARGCEAEVPHLKRPPSEYSGSSSGSRTQPMEEPERPARTSLDLMALDRLRPAAVRDRLPALGLRRPGPRRCPAPRPRACAGRSAASNARALYRPGADGQARRRARSTRSPPAAQARRRCAAGRSRSSTSAASSSRSTTAARTQGGTLCERQAHRARRVGRARATTLHAPGRDPALPLARLGVRHPDRPLLVRSAPAARAQLHRLGRARHAARRGPLRRRDLRGLGRGRLRRRRGLT